MTAASVPDVSCVPSPCSLDASVAGFYKLVLLYDCAASVLDAGRVRAVAVLARRQRRWLLNAGATAAVRDAEGCKFDCLLSILGVGCPPSPCALARRAARLLCWLQLRFSRCSAAVCGRCLSSASAVLRRRVLSLDALPGFYAGFNCAYRVAVLLGVQPLSTIGVCCSPSPCASSLDAPPGFYAGVNCAPRCSGGARALAAAAAAGKQLQSASAMGNSLLGYETCLRIPMRGLRALGPHIRGGRSRWLGRCSGDLAGSLRQARTYGSERTETLCQTRGISSCVGSCVRAFTK